MRHALAVVACLGIAISSFGASTVGEVSFANSGAPEAQAPFLRGLALLHDFEYARAATAFRDARKIDPSFAMAYWGEAMTYNHPIWMQQDRDAALKVLGELGASPAERLAKAKTARERDYLAALDVLYGEGDKQERDFRYADAMSALHAKYPDDVDATAFYALSLLGTAHAGRDFATYMRAAALLEEVFPEHRQHPGVLHYLIHSYDDPIHAPLGLRAARLYGKIAPDAPHALHMTSHIFIALGMWDEVIAANRQALAVGAKTSEAAGHHARGCGHYVNWLHYGYLQEKKFEEAAALRAQCRESALHAATTEEQPVDPDASDVTSYAEMRLFELIDRGTWSQADAIPGSDHYTAARFMDAWGDAYAAIRRGDLAAAREAAKRVQSARDALQKVIDQRKESDPTYRARVGIMADEIEGLIRIRSGEKEAGLALLRKAAESEGSLPSEFGPPAVEKPAWELLGEELLAAGKAEEARAAFREALARAPGRRVAVEGMGRAGGD